MALRFPAPLFLLPPSLVWIAWVFFAAALPAVIGRVNRRYWETLEEAESGRRPVKISVPVPPPRPRLERRRRRGGFHLERETPPGEG